MTDRLSDDELRAACERAGLVWSDALDAWVIPESEWWAADFCIVKTHPALPAYVASRLVAMVRDHEYDKYKYQGSLATQVGAGTGFTARGFFATDTQRIRAAMEVIGDD